jgi:hypothetical protein
MSKQVEQHSNALALETLGWGYAMNRLDAGAVSNWLDYGEGVRLSYPDTASMVADFIERGADGDPWQLVHRLWAQTELPEQAYRDQRVAA